MHIVVGAERLYELQCSPAHMRFSMPFGGCTGEGCVGAWCEDPGEILALVCDSLSPHCGGCGLPAYINPNLSDNSSYPSWKHHQM